MQGARGAVGDTGAHYAGGSDACRRESRVKAHQIVQLSECQSHLQTAVRVDGWTDEG